VRVALVTIAADSAKCCIDEWLNYNKKLGYSKIYIYDSSQNNIYKTLSCNDINVIYLPVVPPQPAAYEHFLSAFKHEYDFTFFSDTDEFLVLKKHMSISNFCEEYFQDLTTGAIAINWKMFGNNFNTHKQEGSVLKNYTKSSRLLNKHIKCIVRNSATMSMKGVHYPRLKDGFFLRNIKGEILPIPTYYNRNNTNDEKTVQLNHYYTKSAEDFVEKCNELHVLAGAKKKLSFFEHIHTMYANEVDDLYAVNFVNFHNSLLFNKNVVVIDLDYSYNAFLKQTLEYDIQLPTNTESTNELNYDQNSFYLIPLRNPIARFVEQFYRTLYDRVIIFGDNGKENIYYDLFKEFRTIKQFARAIKDNTKIDVIHKAFNNPTSLFYKTLSHTISFDYVRLLNANNCHIFYDKNIKESYISFCNKTGMQYSSNLISKLDMFSVFKEADNYEDLDIDSVNVLNQFFIKDILLYKKLSSLSIL
jgi:hypothetical protein